MARNVKYLKITSFDEVPTDVLVEHIAYALRAGLQFSAPHNVEAITADTYSQAYAPKDLV